MALSKDVELILAGYKSIKNSDSYTKYKIEDLAALQNALDKKKYLTVAETGIWLGRSLSTVYREINNGNIIVVRTNNTSGDYRIDVNQTRQKYE